MGSFRPRFGISFFIYRMVLDTETCPLEFSSPLGDFVFYIAKSISNERRVIKEMFSSPFGAFFFYIIFDDIY